jgi:predicted nucleic-acid-binding protein
MIGIDTNVIVRLVVNDDERQSRAAEAFIAEHGGTGEPCYVSDLVLIETVWVLERHYGYDRAMVCDVLKGLLDAAQLEFSSPIDIAAAVEDFRHSRTEFADCLIGRANVLAGCSHTVTFDRKAAKLAGFKLLTKAD